MTDSCNAWGSHKKLLAQLIQCVISGFMCSNVVLYLSVGFAVHHSPLSGTIKTADFLHRCTAVKALCRREEMELLLDKVFYLWWRGMLWLLPVLRCCPRARPRTRTCPRLHSSGWWWSAVGQRSPRRSPLQHRFSSTPNSASQPDCVTKYNFFKILLNSTCQQRDVNYT